MENETSKRDESKTLNIADVTCRTKEVADLIADALLGTLSRETAKDGSSFDKQRKKIIKEITENIYGEHNWKLNVDNMFLIFKAGVKYVR